MKKENNTTDFTKIQAPNFDQLNDIFENNLKIYNNFINNMSEPKKGDQNEKKNDKNKNNFTPVDLLNLIKVLIP